MVSLSKMLGCSLFALALVLEQLEDSIDSRFRTWFLLILRIRTKDLSWPSAWNGITFRVDDMFTIAWTTGFLKGKRTL